MRPVLVLFACLTGCSPLATSTTGGEVALTSAVTDCGGTGVLGQTTQFRVRVFAGTNVENEWIRRASDGLPTTLQVSAGEARRVTLEALTADAKVVAVARSAPVTVAERGTVSLALRLRPVEAFAAVCGTPTAARVGHTAAVLQDGTVWIAGGVGLDSSERFDPQTEQFEKAATLAIQSVNLPRAHATATTMANGQVVLWGGEQGGSPSAITLVYDKDADAVGAVPTRTSPLSIARSRHFAFLIGGDVVALGGSPSQIERFSPTTHRATVEGDLSAAEAAIARVDEQTVLVAGGAADEGRADLVTFGPTRTTKSVRLVVPRRWAAAARLGDGAIVAGGDGAAGASTEWVGRDGAVLPGPAIAPRAEACAVTLADGRVLLVGGRSGPTAVDAAELIALDRTATVVSIPGGPRLHATCTLLSDGSVLVVGGGAPPVRFTPG